MQLDPKCMTDAGGMPSNTFTMLVQIPVRLTVGSNSSMHTQSAMAGRKGHGVRGAVVQVEQLCLPVVVVPALCCIFQLHVADLHKQTACEQLLGVTALWGNKATIITAINSLLPTNSSHRSAHCNLQHAEQLPVTTLLQAGLCEPV